MQPIRFITMGLYAALVGASAFANGGGYSFGVKFTGALAPFQDSGTEHVRIAEEKLRVDLRRTDAAVLVQYTMRNKTKNPVSVKFGFPVEAIKTEDDEEDPRDPAQSGKGLNEAGRKKLMAAIQQLKGYAVRMNGKPVKAEFLTEPFATGEIKPFPGSEVLRGVAGWMVSEVVFPPAASLSVEISYTADHQGDETYVSEDFQNSPLSFHYRMSTGGVWNGPIESGSVTLSADGIPPSEVEILKPSKRFKRIGDKWIWEFRNLEPTLADDITVNAVPGYDGRGYSPDVEHSTYRSYLERLGKWAEGHQRFKATASSALSAKGGHSYGPENLAVWEDEGAPAPWCEGVAGSGLGEYVEIRSLAPKPMLAVGVCTGFANPSKPELFARNARPSRLEILLNGEHRFTATLGDKTDEQLIPNVGYTKPISMLRMVIKDVYPGTRDEDTCISTVILYDRLAKKPNFKHSR